MTKVCWNRKNVLAWLVAGIAGLVYSWLRRDGTRSWR